MIDLTIWVSNIPKQLGHPSAVGVIRHDLCAPEIEAGFSLIGAVTDYNIDRAGTGDIIRGHIQRDHSFSRIDRYRSCIQGTAVSELTNSVIHVGNRCRNLKSGVSPQYIKPHISG